MSREKVLSLLRDCQGEYLSGEAMSRELGISRAGVWKAIEGLRQEGYVISSAPNRGYCLEDAPDLLRAGELSGPLTGSLVGSKLLCLDIIDSTNTECKRQAMAGASEGLVVMAEEQTGGRGRRGRGFQSPRGKGLYLSALFRPDLSPNLVSDFTAWVAVAVCDGIEACCGIRPQIKWTNDIVLTEKSWWVSSPNWVWRARAILWIIWSLESESMSTTPPWIFLPKSGTWPRLYLKFWAILSGVRNWLPKWYWH